MRKVAIFGSGTGSNFEKIADHPLLKKEISIDLVICDKVGAAVIEKAESRGIKTFVFSAKDYQDKVSYEKDILERVKDCQYIFLAGYMRIISPYFLNNYKGIILNLHPSLLPKYKGKDAIKQAFDNKEKEIGISIHYVNEELDGGDVIAQDKLKVLEEDTLESVTERIHKLEHKLYPETILKIITAN